MTEQPKTTPPDGFVDNEPDEEVVNDSLGTVDPADSTGCDSDKKAEAEKAERVMVKGHR